MTDLTPPALQQLLADLGYTPADLARRLGANRAAVTRWLTPADQPGSRTPTGRYARELAQLQTQVRLRAALRGGKSPQEIAAMVTRLAEDVTLDPAQAQTDYERGYLAGYREGLQQFLQTAVMAALTEQPHPLQPPPPGRPRKTELPRQQEQD